MITAQQAEQALAQVESVQVNPGHVASFDAARLAEQVNDELAAWGHAGHEVALERVKPFYGDPRVLRWTFWCEACHVSQVVLLPRPVSSSN